MNSVMRHGPQPLSQQEKRLVDNVGYSDYAAMSVFSSRHEGFEFDGQTLRSEDVEIPFPLRSLEDFSYDMIASSVALLEYMTGIKELAPDESLSQTLPIIQEQLQKELERRNDA
jgi:hypothetical protein